MTPRLPLVAKAECVRGEIGRMFLRDRPAMLRYAVGVTLAGLALGITQLIPGRADPSHFTLFFVSVMLSAWYGGFGGGLAATIVSALSLDFFFIAPIHEIDIDWRAVLRLAVLLSIASITSYLTSARKRAEQDLLQARAELEERVRARTAELAQTNDVLRAEIAVRKKAETELLRLQIELGRVERLATLGRMAGMIAHDLGTPLNSVLGYTQLLTQDDLTSRGRRRLAIIETQINRMIEIIQNYLKRARGPKIENAVNINDLIHDTLVLLQPVFQQHNIQLTSNLAAKALLVNGDSNSLQRVLMNLLDNAVDACEKKGAIEISTRESPGLANKAPGIVIEIADSGVGIPAEVLPTIFELFITTKAPGKGSGFGLVICQEIIKAHHGTIHVTSEAGQGTKVSIYLPSLTGASPGVEETHERPYIDRG